MKSDEDNKNKDEAKSKNYLEDAQLRKLELEIKALERKEKEEEITEPTRQRKLNLELKTLLWQTGRVYRLSQFAIIFSILATLVTVFATSYGIWTSYKKDTENKAKELRERTDNLYRTEIQRLIQYPIEPKITISDAVFLFRDLNDVVINGYEDGEKQKRQKEEVGILLAKLIKSSDVDLSLTRNVEFDRQAMDNSIFYRDYLINNPRYNRDIISKYAAVLDALYKTTPCYSITPDENNEELFKENSSNCNPEEIRGKRSQYSNIFYAYKSHVAILGETISKNPGLAQEAEGYLNISFCWFVAAAKDARLTVKIFGGDSEKVKSKAENDCNIKL